LNVNWCPFSNRWGFGSIIDDKTISLPRKLSASSSVLFAVKLACVATLKTYLAILRMIRGYSFISLVPKVKGKINARQKVNPLKPSDNCIKRFNISQPFLCARREVPRGVLLKV
jgi:hypothetical protein